MHDELIKAFRYCADYGSYKNGCAKCPINADGMVCGTHEDAVAKAADALEAAEKRIEELSLDCEMYQQKCMEMEAQIPKEGEWIDEQRGRWIYAKCNLCGKVQDVRSNYCPNCGARMKGANDEQIH